MVWANVDKPTKKYTIHKLNSCRHVKNMKETALKGISHIKSDGGWLEFDGYSNAVARQQKEFPNYSVSECC